MDRNISNGNGIPRPFTASRSSMMDYPMRDAAERDELESVRSPITPSSPRKRKKLSEGEGEAVRRLRRSHEACTRCRLKKIKASRYFPTPTGCVYQNGVTLIVTNYWENSMTTV